MSQDPARMMRFLLTLRQAGVTDPRVLQAMERVPRSAFAPAALAAVALDEGALPLPEGQSMTAPAIVGQVLAALDLRGGLSVLEVGAGSGYQTALLAALAGRVVTLERRPTLMVEARARLGQARVMTAEVHCADGFAGWPPGAPFDRIVFNGAVEAPPAALVDQLAEGGILVGPVQGSERQRLQRLVKRDGGLSAPVALGVVAFAPLEPGLAPQ